MNNTYKTPRRSTLENRAARIGLELREADTHTKMNAISVGDPKPRWILCGNGRKLNDHGYETLQWVDLALDDQERFYDESQG